MFRALPLLSVLIALSGAPAAAWDVGEKIGPVLMKPGGTICDTAEDARMAILKLDSGQAPPPASCGRLWGRLYALIEVVDHYENRGRTFAILKILFLPPALLGLQYGWTLETVETEKISA